MDLHVAKGRFLRAATLLLSVAGGASLMMIFLCLVVFLVTGKDVDGEYSAAAGMLAAYLTIPALIVGGILGGATARMTLRRS